MSEVAYHVRYTLCYRKDCYTMYILHGFLDGNTCICNILLFINHGLPHPNEKCRRKCLYQIHVNVRVFFLTTFLMYNKPIPDILHPKCTAVLIL